MKYLTERAVVDHNIAELCRIAHTNKIPVITISLINRTSYNGQMNLASFKESGGIEFSADVVWGLQINSSSGKNKSSSETTRDMQLVVLKNRYGTKDRSINLVFYTEIGMFDEKK